MQLYPYLIFNGNADEAMHFYQKVLGGKLSISRFSDLPDFDPETSGLETAQRVLNAQLQWDHAVFMASDTCPEQPSEPMQSVSIALELDDLNRSTDIYEAFATDGEVIMPWAPTFWAEGFGMVKDKFGVTWMINHHIKAAFT